MKPFLIAWLALIPLVALAQGADGEVRKVDKAQGKITLKHGELKSLDMPAMTMVYRVKDPKMLDGVSPGDAVKFDVQKVDGQFVVTTLTKAK